jgi:hypothetical protein
MKKLLSNLTHSLIDKLHYWIGSTMAKVWLRKLEEGLKKGTTGSDSEDLPVDDSEISSIYSRICTCSDLTKDMTGELDAWDLIKQNRPWLCHRLLHGLGPK